MLLATRRARSAGEPGRWLAHWLIGAPGPVVHHETDRERFIGRGRSLAALASGAALSGTAGNVLDPILSLRTIVELAPGERRTLAFGLGFAATRAAALDLVSSRAWLADIAPILTGIPDRIGVEAAPSSGDAGSSLRHRPAPLAAPWPGESPRR